MNKHCFSTHQWPKRLKLVSSHALPNISGTVQNRAAFRLDSRRILSNIFKAEKGENSWHSLLTLVRLSMWLRIQPSLIVKFSILFKQTFEIKVVKGKTRKPFCIAYIVKKYENGKMTEKRDEYRQINDFTNQLLELFTKNQLLEVWNITYSFCGRFLVLPPYLIHRNKHDGQLASDGRIAFSSSSI
jgi:hypothetical protein